MHLWPPSRRGLYAPCRECLLRVHKGLLFQSQSLRECLVNTLKRLLGRELLPYVTASRTYCHASHAHGIQERGSVKDEFIVSSFIVIVFLLLAFRPFLSQFFKVRACHLPCLLALTPSAYIQQDTFQSAYDTLDI